MTIAPQYTPYWNSVAEFYPNPSAKSDRLLATRSHPRGGFAAPDLIQVLKSVRILLFKCPPAIQGALRTLILLFLSPLQLFP